MGCVWGKISQAIGNWSPFVAGANTMANGETFVKIAWNPEFLSAPLARSEPKYGIKIECPDGGCNGLPCSIDPSKDGVNGLASSVGTKGVGGANFCVVTVPKGKTAHIVVFDTGGSEKPATTSKAPSTPRPRPTTISTVARPPSSSTAAVISSWSPSEESSTPLTSPSTTSDDFLGGLFQEQEVSGETQYYTTPDATPAPTTKSVPKVATTVVAMPSNDGAAVDNGGSAIAGLVVALVAAAALY